MSYRYFKSLTCVGTAKTTTLIMACHQVFVGKQTLSAADLMLHHVHACSYIVGYARTPLRVIEALELFHCAYT